MKRFSFFTSFISGSFLHEIYAHINHTQIQAITSNGQCTPEMTLDRFIKITQGIKIQKILVYHVKYKAKRKAKDTLA